MKLFRVFWIAIAVFIIIVMTSIGISFAQKEQRTSISHPLSPLTAIEIQKAVSVIKKEKALSKMVAFPIITLQEPEKEKVLNFKPGIPFERKVFMIAYERSQNKTYETVVDLKTRTINVWQEIPSVQPAIINSEYELAEKVVQSNPQWQQAMRKRGITNFNQVALSAWAPGILSEKEQQTGNRLCRVLSYYKGNYWNFYGRPIEGVIATVNLNTGQVVNVTDSEIIPFSKENWNYDVRSFKKLRQAPKTLKIQQPSGVSFRRNGHEISWQGWNFRYLMHPRDGLVLYQVTYKDGDNIRPVLYRASLSEMVVPYGDPNPNWWFRNAFDMGEYNFGLLANTLELGKDVPANSVLLNAVFADENGQPYVMPRVIGIYERDNGILWKHYDYNTKRNHARRDQELVMTIVAAIDNYDYGINWIFHQDGTIEVQVDLTGIVLAQATASQQKSSQDSPYGQLLAKNIVGVNHQHFFNFRLDMDVESPVNSAMEMNVKALSMDEKNPIGNAFVMEETALTKETDAVRDLDITRSREWMIVSADKKNALGSPTGYMLMPKTNSVLFPVAEAKIRERAGFSTHHVWITKYKPNELYAGGDYPNQTKPGQGLPNYISDDESLIARDIVLWYTMGVTHVPRPEDWPVMPVHQIGFKLIPRGFFNRNPAINLPN